MTIRIKGNSTKFGQYILSHRFGVYQGQDKPATVKDIGRNGEKLKGSLEPIAEKTNVLKLVKE